MQTLRFLGSLALLSSLCAPAAAQDSPRAGSAMWLGGQAPGVWIGPRQLWAPTAGEQALSACAPAGGCAPIVERTSCAAPACPGSGAVLVVAEEVAVAAFPQDYDGFTRELEALRADPRLAALHPYLSTHPEHSERESARARHEEARRREERRHAESVRWVSEHRRGDRFELSLSGGAATLEHAGGAFLGGTAGLALAFWVDDDDADESDDEDTILNIFLGDTLGAELRVHFLHRVDGGQEAEWFTAVGIAPVLTNRFERSVVRLPTFFGTIAPELGVMFRADRDATWYVAWTMPFSFLITHDLALDLVPRLFVVDDWIPKPDPDADSDPAELVFMLSAGFRIP